MTFVYQVTFDIKPDQMEVLEIGASLERVLAYLRMLLPSEMGFINARAMYSLDIADHTHLVFQSNWDTWEDIKLHRESSLLEDRILKEFHPHVPLDDLDAHVFEEVT